MAFSLSLRRSISCCRYIRSLPATLVQAVRNWGTIL